MIVKIWEIIEETCKESHCPLHMELPSRTVLGRTYKKSKA